MKTLTGKCLCEAIIYEIKGEFGPTVNCHCSKCRRWHGAAFRTRSVIKAKNFKWLKGEEHLSKYRSSEQVTRTFCSICGSNLMTLSDSNPNYIRLPIGGLEQDPGTRPSMHVFVGSKTPWYEITDALPQFDTWPPDGPNSVRTLKDKK